MLRYISVGVVNIVNLSHVVVSDPIKVHEAGVIAIHVRFFICALKNFSWEVLLTLLFNLTDFIISIKSIGMIMKFNFSVDLVIESTHHAVIKSVTWMVANNGLPIMKNNFLVALRLYWNTRQRAFDLALAPPWDSVLTIRAIDVHMRNRWMMRSLFHV